MKDSEGMIVLVHNRKVAGALKNLQWSWKIGRAWNTGLITLQRRVGSCPIFIVLLSLHQRLRFVWNFSIGRIDNDAPGGSDAFFCRMAFDIDVGRVAYLPDAAKIRRLAVRQSGRSERHFCLRVASKSKRCNRSGSHRQTKTESKYPNVHFDLTFLPPSSSV